MNIAYNAWHVRLIKTQLDNYPKSLCGYFWAFVISVLLVPFTWPFMIVKRYDDSAPPAVVNIVACFIGFLPLVFFATNDDGQFTIPLYIVLFLAPVIGFVLSASCGVALWACVTFVRWLWHFRKPRDPDAPPRITRILWEGIKAKKRRICPLIQYVERKV